MVVILLSSCDKDELLDINPYSKKVPQSVGDFELLMMQRYDFGSTSQGRVPSYETDLLLSDDIEFSEMLYNQFASQDIRFADALIWEKDFGAIDDLDWDWYSLYNQIQVMNTVISQLIDPEIDGEQSKKDALISEAKVHRAFAYYSLINLYAKQYDATTASSDLGVPIRISPEFGATPRASVQEVYDLILKDLDEALLSNSLPGSVTENNWRASVAAAHAVRAKVYLAMGNYKAAKDDAEACLDLYSTLVDANTLMGLPNNFENEEVILLKGQVGPLAFAFVDVRVSNELISMYDADDLRTQRYNTGWTPNVFDLLGLRSKVPHIGLSVPEMYLIKAECNSRPGGDFAQAIDDLNTLRVNRYRTGTYTDLTTSELPDAATTLAFIKEERRRELAGQGVRWFDLKRYNAFDGDNISITRELNGVIHTLEPNSNRWIIPISRRDINLAPELVQSPR